MWVSLAWGYVGTRVVHGLMQAVISRILTRSLFFFVSSLLLFALTARVAMLMF